MIRISVFFMLMIGLTSSAVAQSKYLCRNGQSSFYSKAMSENIEAHNSQTSAVLDSQTGALAVSIPVSGFKFEKALMQEHFNENYMETGKYPKAIFKGKIVDFSNMDFTEQATVKISGEITIHGVTKAIQIDGTLGKKNENIVGTAAFDLKVADFDIKIPKVVINNIAETVQVMIDLEFKAQAN